MRIFKCIVEDNNCFKERGCFGWMWKKTANRNSVYEQIVRRGFILTEGFSRYTSNNTSFSTVYLPNFNLLKVHRSHPFKIFDSGSGLVVIPKGDERLAQQILDDENPSVYDSVSFSLWPDSYLDSDLKYCEARKVQDSAFTNLGGESEGVSLVYSSRGALVDERGIDTFSVIPPSQIHKHFCRWANLNHDIFGRMIGDSARTRVGTMVVDPHLHTEVGKALEKRFRVQIFAERDR